MNQLVDRFNRTHEYLRIAVTDRCNLRCAYCMPPNGITCKQRAEILSFEEIERLISVFANLGIRKLRLTGGEPLVRRNLDSLVRGLGGIHGVEHIGLTTNGVLLDGQVGSLQSAGLNSVNISLDSLRLKRFRSITRRNDLPEVLKGIQSAIALGFERIKINTVVMKDVNDDEICEFVRHFRTQPVSLRFIEFMPFTHNGWEREKLLPAAEIRDRLSKEFELTSLQGRDKSVSQDYHLRDTRCTVGIIASMTESFCDSCTRLRLTADGWLKTCLFYPAEVCLRDHLRAGATNKELRDLILGTVNLKRECHPSLHDLPNHENQTMIEIGG